MDRNGFKTGAVAWLSAWRIKLRAMVWNALICVMLSCVMTLLPVSGLCTEKQPGNKKNAAASEKKHKKSARPPRSFTPSERIGADQAVAFPVDI